jgi:tRNA-dihydrouridine synthase B
MSGISTAPYRKVCSDFGADLGVAEMIPADGLVRKPKVFRAAMERFAGEKVLWVQLFGKNPDSLADAAKVCEQMGAEMTDLNMGCPVKRVTSSGSGSALMKDPLKAALIMRKMRGAVSTPLSVKIRSGWDDKSINAVEIARIAEAEGFELVTVHSRTRAQQFKGMADWRVITQVREAVKIKVFGNGDVDSPKAAHRMFAETGCDGIMIGRGALGRPWLFGEARSFMDGGAVVETEPQKRLSAILLHLELMARSVGEYKALLDIRKFMVWYLKSMPGAREFRLKLFASSGLADFETELRGFFERAENSGRASASG